MQAACFESSGVLACFGKRPRHRDVDPHQPRAQRLRAQPPLFAAVAPRKTRHRGEALKILIRLMICHAWPSAVNCHIAAASFHAPAISTVLLPAMPTNDAHLQRAERHSTALISRVMQRVTTPQPRRATIPRQEAAPPPLRIIGSTSPINGFSAGLTSSRSLRVVPSHDSQTLNHETLTVQYSAHAPARSREVRHREDESGLVGRRLERKSFVIT
jgi:hypothetical protein